MVKMSMSAAFYFSFSCFKVDVFSLTFLITFLVRDFHLLLEDLLQLLGFFLLGVLLKVLLLWVRLPPSFILGRYLASKKKGSCLDDYIESLSLPSTMLSLYLKTKVVFIC